MTASVPLGWLSVNDQIDQFQAAIRQNHTLMEILSRAPALNIPNWYLASGCLFQTVWNVVTGQPPESGIADYDLIYFDGTDLSWEAEDAIIQRGKEIFAGLDAEVEIRNQARVHLWYEAKFGTPARGIARVKAPSILTIPRHRVLAFACGRMAHGTSTRRGGSLTCSTSLSVPMPCWSRPTCIKRRPPDGQVTGLR